MRNKVLTVVIAAIAASTLVAWTAVPDEAASATFVYGTPALESIGAIAFGPDNVLFVGDSQGAAVYAIDMPDTESGDGPVNVRGLDTKLAAMFGTTADDITVRDLAIHPASHNVYLSVSRGDGSFALVKVDGNGTLSEVSLADVQYSKGDISNAPALDATYGRRGSARQYTITDLAFADGEVMVAGLSNQEFASNFRRMPFPFTGDMDATSLEIYHVSHGQYETHAPVDTFTPYVINGSVYVVASYTCTPLVLFGLEGLEDGAHVMGTTVAELGAGNRPLDIITYSDGSGDFVLVANSRHPLMKIDASNFASAESLVSPTRETGVPFETMPQPGIQRLGERGDHIVMLQSNDGLHLISVAKDSL